jgi:hypothetical protein
MRKKENLKAINLKEFIVFSTSPGYYLGVYIPF